MAATSALLFYYYVQPRHVQFARLYSTTVTSVAMSSFLSLQLRATTTSHVQFARLSSTTVTSVVTSGFLSLQVITSALTIDCRLQAPSIQKSTIILFQTQVFILLHLEFEAGC